jgi:hypothetical protein
MDRTIPPSAATSEGDSSTHPGPGADPCPSHATQGGPPLIAAKAFVQTVRHFFPDLNDWFQALPDTRDPDAIIYETRFLVWWGLLLFLLQLASRRQLDFALDSYGPGLLNNLNRLAGTAQETRPVHDTLDHFLGHVGVDPFHELRRQMVYRLIRMKALDDARLLGYSPVLIDGTGVLTFRERHCDTCLERKTKHGTLYMHHVLEAKLVGPGGLVISIGTEFIENSDAAASQSIDPEKIKQDCELKAFARLAPRLKADFPQLQIVLLVDALFACGTFFQIAKDNDWSYVATFKEGRLPIAWSEFERLMPLCPENVRRWSLPDNTRREFRWVNAITHIDDHKRTWSLNALQCEETSPTGERQRFAWLTPLPVRASTIDEIAQKGGRTRWKIENEGFNRQKNSGLNLEHPYSHDPEKWKAYYYLLQIAFIITQLVERGSLLRQLAAELNRTPLQLFGSLANIVRRLRDALQYFTWPDDCFDDSAAHARRIHFDTS